MKVKDIIKEMHGMVKKQIGTISTIGRKKLKQNIKKQILKIIRIYNIKK